MADYLKLFSTQADYDAYISSDYPKPNVSYIEATDETIFTNYQDGPAGPESVITGLKVEDFTGTTFYDYPRYVTEVYIPEGVTTTANFAFGSSSSVNYINIEKVTVPTTLATVGPGTFSYCKKLKTVEGLKDTAVTQLPHFTNTLYSNGMFENCTALTSIELPSGLTSIDQYTFENCTALTSIVIPTNVTSIGNYAFNNCTALTSVSFPSGLTSIGQVGFSTCSALTSVDLSGTSVTSIGNNAFANCTSLTSVTLPSTVTSIGNNAFVCNTSPSATLNITILATTPPTLGTDVFKKRNNINIYVPASAVETYKAASGWSAYESKIQAIPA